MAQYKILEAAASENYFSSLKRLVKNWPFDLLILTYGEPSIPRKKSHIYLLKIIQYRNVGDGNDLGLFSVSFQGFQSPLIADTSY